MERCQNCGGFRKEIFTLRAIIFVTITDYPGQFSLSGQIKGKTGCCACIDGTRSTYLQGSNKLVYMGHRRFLVPKHRYRDPGMNKFFDGKDEPETDEPKSISYGQKVSEMVKDLNNVEFGKKKKEDDGPKPRKRKRSDPTEEEAVPKVPFKKQSCFFK